MPSPRDRFTGRLTLSGLADLLFGAPGEAEGLLRRTEGALTRTSKLLQCATDQLTLARAETPRIAALRNELQVLRATVRLLEQAVLRERERVRHAVEGSRLDTVAKRRPLNTTRVP